ncbi:12938_t:CDS:1, partial [Rhizophagus irregularis]
HQEELMLFPSERLFHNQKWFQEILCRNQLLNQMAQCLTRQETLRYSI